MADLDTPSDTGDNGDYRAEISRRSLRRDLVARERKISNFMFGVLAYSGVVTLITGITLLLADGPGLFDVCFTLAHGTLYGFAAYRLWVKGDAPAWLIALPVVISLILMAIIRSAAPFFLLLNLGLLVAIPLRLRARKSLAAIPS